MLSLGSTRRYRPLRAAAGLLLYLLTIGVTPLVHAQHEREFGTPSFEASHSAQCLPLHDEAVCVACSAHSTITVPRVSGCATDDTGRSVPLTVRFAPAPSAPDVAPAAARAPPQH